MEPGMQPLWKTESDVRGIKSLTDNSWFHLQQMMAQMHLLRLELKVTLPQYR